MWHSEKASLTDSLPDIQYPRLLEGLGKRMEVPSAVESSCLEPGTGTHPGDIHTDPYLSGSLIPRFLDRTV